MEYLSDIFYGMSVLIIIWFIAFLIYISIDKWWIGLCIIGGILLSMGFGRLIRILLKVK